MNFLIALVAAIGLGRLADAGRRNGPKFGEIVSIIAALVVLFIIVAFWLDKII